MLEKIMVKFIWPSVWQIDIVWLKKILRDICIFYWPVLVYIINQLSTWMSIDWKMAWSMAIWITLSFFKRFYTDYAEKDGSVT